MSIRTKLFTFLLALVVLMNLVTFFIYQSSRTIQESYTLMTERILLYKQIANFTEDNLRLLSNYLVNQNSAAYAAFFDRKQELEKLRAKLEVQSRTESRAVAATNFRNMVTTFLEAEEAVIGILYRTDARSYAQQYEEVEKTAGYIQEENQQLVDQELSFYQPLYQNMLVYTGRMNVLGLGLLAVDVVLCVVFALWLSRSITKPIANLVNVAVQIAKGNLDVEPPTAQMSDEIGILTRTFRHMLASLKELLVQRQEMAEKDRLVKELEIKALQSQINPHFLFNTLNVLSKLALLEGAERTSDLTVSVSNLLRYNLRKLDTPVTLRDEVEHAREYFAIQQARFRDRVTFDTDIEEAALDLPIPCMTLQPILENAFVHGIEGMESGARIRLYIRREGTFVVIAVSDNGAGMSDETRRRLLRARSGFAEGQADLMEADAAEGQNAAAATARGERAAAGGKRVGATAAMEQAGQETGDDEWGGRAAASEETIADVGAAGREAGDGSAEGGTAETDEWGGRAAAGEEAVADMGVAGPDAMVTGKGGANGAATRGDRTAEEAGAIVAAGTVAGDGRVTDDDRLEHGAVSAGTSFGRSAKGQSTGLGTRNVYRRLQLFYGMDGLVTIASEPGAGTTVTIRAPWPRAGEGGAG